MMERVAVIAHAGKSIGGGLPELRRVLAERGIEDPIWHEVAKSRKAPKQVRRALAERATLVIVWGGDGMVQRSVDVVAGRKKVAIGIIPAGTANLFASNLGIPKDIEQAVDVALAGHGRRLDIGRINGEGFAVMAGIGFDARMIADADSGLKDRIGRVAYVWTGAKNLRSKTFKATIVVDGAEWFRDSASCILVGNVGRLVGGVEAFEDARPDDGLLELGVVTASGVLQWTRTLAHAIAGSAAASPYARATKAHTIEVKLSRKVLLELDGGDRKPVRSIRIQVEPDAIEVRVPGEATEEPAA